MKNFPKLNFIKPLLNYKLYIEFADGIKGEINLSHLAQKGVFKKWDNGINFNSVFINKENGTIAWDEELEIDSDSQYLKLIGKSFEEWIKTEPNYA